MDVDVVAHAPPLIDHALEDAPVRGVAKLQVKRRNVRVVGLVNPVGLAPRVDRDYTHGPRVDGPGGEASHPGEEVDEGDRLAHALTRWAQHTSHTR